MRKLAAATLLVLVAGGCGSSPAPANGPILAWHWSGNGALYSLRPDGSRLRKIADLPARGVAPVRVGDWIYYNTVLPITTPKVSYYRTDLWRMRLDGTHRTLIARNVPLDALSPDGRTIAFSEDACTSNGFNERCSDMIANSQELYTIGIDGSDRRRLTHNGTYDGEPSWSPDGKSIAYATDAGVRIMDRDGRHDRTLIKGSDYSTVPDWSPRSDRILISGLGRWRVVATDGHVLYKLDPGPPGPKWAPVWSPDGRRIAYLGERAKQWTAEDPLQVWVMNADGSGRHPLTRSFGWSISSWSPA
jgi:Tol biopolymer transport system component